MAGADSDYGSDLDPEDQAVIDSLLADAENAAAEDDHEDAANAYNAEEVVTTTVPAEKARDVYDEAPAGIRLPVRPGRGSRLSLVASASADEAWTSIEPPDIVISKQEDERVARSTEEAQDAVPSLYARDEATRLTPDPNVPDSRSPLERFRTKPKKPLSVSDLISPSWCQLQYWFTLTKHGRKRPTPAMKQGSALHKTLEEQVHQTVEIKIQTREDRWGLKIWNIISSLKTLRETGRTREIEVWGVLEGEVVNGVVDELSYVCPDAHLEESGPSGQSKASVERPADQTTLDGYVKKPNANSIANGVVLRTLSSLSKLTPRIYLTEFKTPATRKVPKGASFRSTLFQLMLYRLLLGEMATNKVDPEVLFQRYDLDPDTPFSDEFLAQILSGQEVYYDATPEPQGLGQDSEPRPDLPDSSQATIISDPMELLLEHNTLRKAWELMMREFQHVMPNGEKSIGNVLKVEYRDYSDLEILGIKTFLYDEALVRGYVESEMQWWRGEREAQGVCIEEAYKCRSCEFAETCDWRIQKVSTAKEAFRERAVRRRSVV